MSKAAGLPGSWCEYHQLNHIAEHGSASTYTNHKCRCVDCTAAWAVRHREWCLKRHARGVPDHVHGTVNGYTNYRCRCESCRIAHSTASREKRERARSKRAA